MKSLLFAAAAAVAGSVATARADIAAVEHMGHGLIAIEAPTVRMVSAKVDITWGEPGRLSAVFVMDNESADAADVQLGFPVSLPVKFRRKGGLDFTMTFDGVPIDRTAVRQDTPAKDEHGSRNHTLWFHCRHRFHPGVTTVKVDTKLPATAAYRLPYRENLSYRIDTGAGWKGRIGWEEVAIHFPRPLRSEDIETSEPPGGVLDGNTVRWRFEDFEPDGHDHDISLQFLHPCVLPVLDDLRRQSAKAPHDLRKRLNLIRHLLGLCDPRRDYPYFSEEMLWQDWEEILAMLSSDEDRARFQKLFTWGPDGAFELTGAESNVEGKVEEEVETMLSAIGYVQRWVRSTFLVEGRELLARFLKEHPHDANAWNIDLLHYVGFPGEVQFEPYQMERIRAALENCPTDSTIRLWDAYRRLYRQRLEMENFSGFTPLAYRLSAKERQLIEQLRRRGAYDFRFEQRSYDYYFD